MLGIIMIIVAVVFVAIALVIAWVFSIWLEVISTIFLLIFIGFFFYGLFSLIDKIKLKKLRRNYNAEEDKSKPIGEGPTREQFRSGEFTGRIGTVAGNEPISPGDFQLGRQEIVSDEVAVRDAADESRDEEPEREPEKDWPSFD